MRPSARRSASEVSRASRTTSSSSASLGKRIEVGNIVERLEKAERINAKLEVKEKEKKFKFAKLGCEKQFKFNSKMKDLFGEDLKVELEKHFKEGLPEGVGGLVKEAEKEIDDQNLRVKIADEFGYKAMEDFIKEDLARDEKEEKKIKALRKEKKEREEKFKGKGGRVFPSRAWGSRVGSRDFAERDFDKKKSWRLGVYAHKDTECYNCQGVGHMARDCVEPSSGRKGKK